MSTYRTLGCLPSPCVPQRAILGPEDCLRLASRTAAGGVAVCHALENGDLARLCAELPAGVVQDRGAKRPHRPLGAYFAGRGGLVRLRADYRAAAQALRGLHALVDACEGPWGGLYLVGLPAAVFAELWGRASPAEAPAEESGAPAGGGAQRPAAPAPQPLARRVRVPIPALVRARLVGRSAAAEWVHRQIVLAARSVHPVLIQGEVGTGKEVAARLIHDLGERRARRLQFVPCAAFAGEALAAELFGRGRAALAGSAGPRTGAWTLARGSTLVLDEVADLSLPLQARVLRALQTGRYVPEGGSRELASDARVIAITERDLGALVRAGRFREDLYWRLFALRIRPPALREHAEDIPAIAAALWRKVAGRRVPPLAPEVTAELARQPWPGNVRELRACLANLALLAAAAPVTAALVREVLREREGMTVA